MRFGMKLSKFSMRTGDSDKKAGQFYDAGCVIELSLY